jgi:hypothetical protein
MTKCVKMAAMAGALACFGAAQAVWTTSEATFTSNLLGAFYLEDFNNFTYGSPLNGQATWAAPGANGYGWTAGGAPGGLWSNAGALSTNTASDPIVITMTGAPVTAFGGIFANTDINGNTIAGTLTISFNGGAQTQVAAGSNGFLGWYGTTPIASVTIQVDDAPGQVDHFYVGSAVPEPATMAALGLGAIALIRRRRK